MTLVVECGPEHSSERRYVIDVLFGTFLGLDYRITESERGDVLIRLVGDDRRMLVISDVLFSAAESLLDPSVLPGSPLAWCGRTEFPGATVLGDLPVLYGGPTSKGSFVAVDPERVELGLDVLGGSFVMLTRLEEAGDGARDHHARFPATASLAQRNGFLDRPVVNEYAEVLWWALTRLWPRLERRTRQFRLLPTHDVDWPFYSRGVLSRSIRAATSDVVQRRNYGLAAARLRSAYAVRRSGQAADPCNTFDFLMAESEGRGLRSAFYFMTAHTHPTFDGDYSIDDPWIRELIGTIARRGHEVGLHPSYGTYLDGPALASEFQLLRRACEEEGIDQVAFGGRQHFLRWANPFTWRNWDDAGLSYDSTLGYPEASGFRSGTCYEYPVFDLQQRKALRLVERPLIAMEATAINYQGLALEEAAQEMRRLRELCRTFDGDFAFLWHNNRLAADEERRAYVAILDP